MQNQKPHLAFKIWLETDKGYVFGPGIYSLLCVLREKGTLKEAANTLSMSYRYAWGLLHKAERTLGEPLIITHKGGRHGGGGTEITKTGIHFIEDYSRLNENTLIISRNQERYFGIVKSVTDKKESVEVILNLIIGSKLKPGDEVSLFINK
jgi:molybdate transport repressor ModE-like protein